MSLLFRLLGLLPLRLLHALGAAAGCLVWWASPRYRQVLVANYQRALQRAPTRAELAAAIREAGKAALETAWVWRSDGPELRARVRLVSGLAAMQAAREAGRGAVFITPHLGCFEASARLYAELVGPITVLFRRPRKAVLAPLMDAGRNRGRMRAVPADAAGVRQLLKALKAGEAIGILPDQVPQAGEGVWAPFFGTPAYTMTLASRLIGLNGAAAFLVFVERLPSGAGFHMHVEALSLPAAPLAERVAALNLALEAAILRFPAQYLWGYKRFKRPAGVPPAEGAA